MRHHRSADTMEMEIHHLNQSEKPHPVQTHPMQARPVHTPYGRSPDAPFRTRRPFQVIALLLTLVVSIAIIAGACGAASTGSKASSTVTSAAATTAAGMYDKGKDGFSGNESKGAASAPQSTNLAALATKIIRNANLDIEADDVLKAYESLLQHAAANGGYEASRKVSTNETYTVLEAKIKIKPEFLDDLLTFAGTTGKIINVQTTSQDITESYYDTQTRLTTMEAMLKKYNEFLTNAKTVQEALSVQSEINRLTAEIEVLKGKLRYYDTMVAESTVTLLIRQTSDPVKIKKEIKWNALTSADMGYLMQRGLMGVVNTLTGVFQWLSILLVAASPLIIIAVIVLLILIRRRRRHRKNANAPGNNPIPPTDLTDGQ